VAAAAEVETARRSAALATDAALAESARREAEQRAQFVRATAQVNRTKAAKADEDAATQAALLATPTLPELGEYRDLPLAGDALRDE
jgi:hypothetical protein